MPTPGYSGTPLAKKLGIRSGHCVVTRGAPADYEALVAPLPEDVTLSTRFTPRADIVHVFVKERAMLARLLGEYRAKLRPDARVWVSWPKKTAKVATDVTEDVIRDVALPLGFVDIKVCAVDATWSGLALVVRKELR